MENNFTKGFNHGYLLAKYLPDLFAKLEPSINTSNAYFQGIFCGSLEWGKENLKMKFEELNRLRDRSDNKEKEREIS